MRVFFAFLLVATASVRGADIVFGHERLEVRLDPDAGALAVTDKIAGCTYRQHLPTREKGAARFRNVARDGNRVAFDADFWWKAGAPLTVRVTLTLAAGAADLAVEADCADRAVRIERFAFLEPLVLDSAAGVLAVADYSDGHIYPLDRKPFPRTWFDGDRLDMPWVGVCDLAGGFGYTLVLETSDDAVVQLVPCRGGVREVVAPRVLWQPIKGSFGAPRKLLYRFVPKGSYVALAKSYRELAAAQGLLVTLGQKAAANPNLARLFGAPDVWGDASLEFVRRAKAAGVEKMLIHGRASAQDMRAINALGYLTSEYDNYTDILAPDPGKGIDASHDNLPEAAALKADGTRMTAWLTWDKKTQYMKRCPALWERAARAVVPKVLAELPFLGRFIDVTTAEALYECYDPAHPLTRADKRACGGALLAYVRSLGLVMGGEHGIWWGVPHLDYIEGMMSGGYASWPAGHLIHPKSKDESFTSPWGRASEKWGAYEEWGIGHAWRAPLWELVFHDCIVSTWYWGDASDWLRVAAPEVEAKKDAFNILYGTIPLLWANGEGSWRQDRAAFLRTYRVTCPLHEAIAGAEMLAHEALTPGRDVQRTTFSDATEVVVNFGSEPYALARDGRTFLLPRNGFFVKGPKIAQTCVLENGVPVTTVERPGFFYIQRGGVELCARAESDEKLIVQLHALDASARFEPRRCVAAWDLATTRAYLRDPQGERIALAPCTHDGDDVLLLGPCADGANIELLCGKEAVLPDLLVERVAIEPARVPQGHDAVATVVVRNAGGAPARDATLGFFADTRAPERLLATLPCALAPGQRANLTQRIDTVRLDGERRLVVAIEPASSSRELCTRNNSLEATLEVQADPKLWHLGGERALAPESVPWRGLPITLPCEDRIDPASVRASPFPAQVVGGAILVLLPGSGPTPEKVSWRANAPDLPAPLFAPCARLWRQDERAIHAETYRVRFENGTLVDLAAVRDGKAGPAFVTKLIVSSRETGWTEEPGTVEGFEVLESGPVRTSIVVTKSLRANVKYTKRYDFYPRYFEVATTLQGLPGGVYSRAYYAKAGAFVAESGARAAIDGTGDGEDVIGTRARWYAVHASDWAHSCTSLDGASTLTYWDSSERGGIGFSAVRNDRPARMRYTIRPGAPDASFGADDAREVEVKLR